MITIAGGKLTGYRLMAKRAVDMIFSKKTCRTKISPLMVILNPNLNRTMISSNICAYTIISMI